MFTSYIIYTNPTMMNILMTIPYLFNSDYNITGNISCEPEEANKNEENETRQTVSYLDITQSSWFEVKEKKNADRRNIITSMCSKLDSVVNQFMKFRLQFIFISEKNMISYCRVPKIASTTWTHFFLRTGKG